MLNDRSVYHPHGRESVFKHIKGVTDHNERNTRRDKIERRVLTWRVWANVPRRLVI
jgi:hypothetical protein